MSLTKTCSVCDEDKAPEEFGTRLGRAKPFCRRCTCYYDSVKVITPATGRRDRRLVWEALMEGLWTPEEIFVPTRIPRQRIVAALDALLAERPDLLRKNGGLYVPWGRCKPR